MKKFYYFLFFFIISIPIWCHSQCLVIKSSNLFLSADFSSRTSSSGDPSIDAKVKQYYNALRKLFNISATIYFLPNDRGSYAIGDGSGVDDELYFGIPLIKSSSKFSESDAFFAFLVAHEMAHLFQYKTMTTNRFFTRDNLKFNSAELQADFLAGSVLCTSNLVDAELYNTVFKAAEYLGEYEFNDVRHHGTPSQRSYVVGYGLQSCGIQELSELLEKSFYYVNPSNILNLKEANIYGRYQLYIDGQEMFNGHKHLHFNEDKEIFIEEYNAYTKIGFEKPLLETQSGKLLDINYDNKVVQLKVKDNGKVYDNKGNKIGEMLFYTDQFPAHRPGLIANLTDIINTGYKSPYSPSICVVNDIVWIAFVSEDNSIKVAQNIDGINYVEKGKIEDEAGSAPSLVYSNQNFYLSWVGTDRKLNILKSVDGLDWTGTIVNFDETCFGKVAAVNFNNKIFLAWRELNGHIKLVSTEDGQVIQEQYTLEEICNDDPILFTCNEDIFIGWTSSDKRKLHVIRSDLGDDFFFKETREIVYSSVPAIHSSYSPVLASIGLHTDELWFCWTNMLDGYQISLSNQICYPNKVQFKAMSSASPAINYPFIAWTNIQGAICIGRITR